MNQDIDKSRIDSKNFNEIGKSETSQMRRQTSSQTILIKSYMKQKEEFQKLNSMQNSTISTTTSELIMNMSKESKL